MEIPLDANGRVNLFAFADGFAPFRATLQPEAAASYDIEMMPALPSHSQMTFDIRTEQSPNRLGWVRIDADVSAGGAPLCALVLANGQHAYSCADNTGAISLEAPTDARGAVTLFGFADGFLPYKRVLTP